MLRKIGTLVDNPHTAQAAVEVLETAGSQALVPEPSLCCGRPPYDWGMLDLGARTLHQTLDALAPLIQAGVPLVGLEPSCVAGFRDAFGFERGEHYDVSLKAGERVLLPAVRSAAPDTWIIADGFSCGEQIAQASGRPDVLRENAVLPPAAPATLRPAEIAGLLLAGAGMPRRPGRG